jgi:hypothetical protein
MVEHDIPVEHNLSVKFDVKFEHDKSVAFNNSAGRQFYGQNCIF